MSSIPPPERRHTPPPLLQLPTKAAESRLFFSLEGAPPQTCTTRAWRSGVAFDTNIVGEVVRVGEKAFDIRAGESTVSLRHLLPAVVDLRPLLGRWVSVRLEEHFEAARWTRHLEVRNLKGRALLVARDGQLPRDGAVLGLTTRASFEGDEARLAVGNAPQLARVRAGEVHRMIAEDHPMDLAVLRLGGNDAALLWVAR